MTPLTDKIGAALDEARNIAQEGDVWAHRVIGALENAHLFSTVVQGSDTPHPAETGAPPQTPGQADPPAKYDPQTGQPLTGSQE